MAIKKQKVTSLYWLFLKYLALFCFYTILLIVTLYLILFIGINSGFILPANYAEQTVKQISKQIADMDEFDENVIPFPCKYVLFEKNTEVLSSNMNQKEIDKAQEVWRNSEVYTNEWYTIIHREDSVCIISYDMYPHFSSPVLHRIIHNPEWCGIALFFGGFITIAIGIAVAFGRKLKRELEPIIEATEAIKQQNLHFHTNATQIREFNTVLNSIKDMRAALEESLKQQWSMEQNRKMQISAITHDIKTPLTIIKGNTELLQESELALEDKELLEYIQTSSDKIEKYLVLLMKAAEAERADDCKPDCFIVNDCIQEIKVQAEAQCKRKNIVLSVKEEVLTDIFWGDKELIIRAVSNILDNAVEYTPELGKIEFIVSGNAKQLTFTIKDNGKGFSQNSLHSATQQFYTECEARLGKHYGLGLFIAETVAKKHNGELLIRNRQNGTGAEVRLVIKEIIGS